MANKIETIDQINEKFDQQESQIRSLVRTASTIIDTMSAQQQLLETLSDEVKKCMTKIHVMQF